METGSVDEALRQFRLFADSGMLITRPLVYDLLTNKRKDRLEVIATVIAAATAEASEAQEEPDEEEEMDGSVSVSHRSPASASAVVTTASAEDEQADDTGLVDVQLDEGAAE